MIQSAPINAPAPQPKATFGQKVKNAVTNTGIHISNAVIKTKNSARATVHREYDKHFIYGEIHNYNANQAIKSDDKKQASRSNRKAITSYTKSLAYSKVGQKTKLW